jgi:hypothetical protein
MNSGWRAEKNISIIPPQHSFQFLLGNIWDTLIVPARGSGRHIEEYKFALVWCVFLGDRRWLHVMCSTARLLLRPHNFSNYDVLSPVYLHINIAFLPSTSTLIGFQECLLCRLRRPTDYSLASLSPCVGDSKLGCRRFVSPKNADRRYPVLQGYPKSTYSEFRRGVIWSVWEPESSLNLYSSVN